MVTFDFTGLLVVAVVAFVAPILASLIPRHLVPAAVLERSSSDWRSDPRVSGGSSRRGQSSSST
jgi:hypothetical protein